MEYQVESWSSVSSEDAISYESSPNILSTSTGYGYSVQDMGSEVSMATIPPLTQSYVDPVAERVAPSEWSNVSRPAWRQRPQPKLQPRRIPRPRSRQSISVNSGLKDSFLKPTAQQPDSEEHKQQISANEIIQRLLIAEKACRESMSAAQSQRIIELETQNSKLEARNSKLEASNSKLEVHNLKLENDISQQQHAPQARINELEKENSHLKYTLQERDQKFIILQVLADELKSDKSNLMIEKAAIQQSAQELGQELRDAQKTIYNLQTPTAQQPDSREHEQQISVDEIIQKLLIAEKTPRQLDAHQSKLENDVSCQQDVLQARINELEKENSHLKDTLREKDEKFIILQVLSDDRKSDKSNLLIEKAAIQQSAQELGQELRDAQKAIYNLQTEIFKLKLLQQKLESENAKLQNTLDVKEQKLNSAFRAIDGQQVHMAEQRVEISRLEDEICTLQHTVYEQCQELNAAEEGKQVLQMRVDDLRADRLVLEGDKTDLQNLVLGLQEAFTAQQADLVKLQAENAKLMDALLQPITGNVVEEQTPVAEKQTQVLSTPHVMHNSCTKPGTLTENVSENEGNFNTSSASQGANSGRHQGSYQGVTHLPLTLTGRQLFTPSLTQSLPASLAKPGMLRVEMPSSCAITRRQRGDPVDNQPLSEQDYVGGENNPTEPPQETLSDIVLSSG